jgi:hypothetical protein
VPVGVESVEVQMGVGVGQDHGSKIRGNWAEVVLLQKNGA